MKSGKYSFGNPFVDIHSEKDIMDLAIALVEDTQKDRSLIILYSAMIGLMYYYMKPSEQNAETFVHLLGMVDAEGDNEGDKSVMDMIMKEREKEYRKGRKESEKKMKRWKKGGEGEPAPKPFELSRFPFRQYLLYKKFKNKNLLSLRLLNLYAAEYCQEKGE